MHGGSVGSGGITSGAEGRVWSAVEGVGPTRGEGRCRCVRVGAAGGGCPFLFQLVRSVVCLSVLFVCVSRVCEEV